MVLRIIRPAPPAAAGAFRADRRLCLTADRARVVEPTDPAAAFLFVTRGGAVSQVDATRFGLELVEGVVCIVGPAAPGSPVAETTPAPAPAPPPPPAPPPKAAKPGRAAAKGPDA